MAQVILWNTMVSPQDKLSYLNRPSGGWAVKNWLETHGYTVAIIDFCQTMPVQDLEELTLAHIDDTTLCIGMGVTFFEFYMPPWAHQVANVVLEKIQILN